jgi:hypothetical protein
MGGARDCTLADALQFAGLRSWTSGEGRDENKVKPLYGFGIPLVLLMATGESGVSLYRDDNHGLAYRHWYVNDKEQKFPPPGSAALKVRGVVLRKAKGTDKTEYSLPLYWYEPQEEGTSDREEAP